MATQNYVVIALVRRNHRQLSAASERPSPRSNRPHLLAPGARCPRGDPGSMRAVSLTTEFRVSSGRSTLGPRVKRPSRCAAVLDYIPSTRRRGRRLTEPHGPPRLFPQRMAGFIRARRIPASLPSPFTRRPAASVASRSAFDRNSQDPLRASGRPQRVITVNADKHRPLRPGHASSNTGQASSPTFHGAGVRPHGKMHVRAESGMRRPAHGDGAAVVPGTE